MERAKEIELLSTCLALVENEKPFVTHDETLVPVARYLDEARYQQERELLFRRAMNLVAHTSQVAGPGDFITRDVVGTPVLLVRDKDGEARAFVNVCRHRGATVELRESGSCRRFVCPYHAWTYATDGSLVAARHAEGFPSLDPSQVRLAELVCYEAAGFIWVCPSPNVDAWEPDAGTLSMVAELERLGCASAVAFNSDSRVWNANWKLIVDGGLESYHFRIAHRDTIAGFFPDNVSTFEFLGEHVRSVLPRTSILELADQPQSEWDIRKHTHLLYSIAPNASILMQERHFDLILSNPASVGQTHIEITTFVPKPNGAEHDEKANAFFSANHAFTKKTLEEDFALGEQIQRGMQTGVNEHFRFATFEGALTEWHRRLERKLSGE